MLKSYGYPLILGSLGGDKLFTFYHLLHYALDMIKLAVVCPGPQIESVLLCWTFNNEIQFTTILESCPAT